MKSKPTIALITSEDPGDVNAWSGTLYYLDQALKEAGCKVIHLGPASPFFSKWILAIANQVSMRFFRRRIDYRRSPLYARSFARLFHRRLEQYEYDIAVALGGPEFIAYLRIDKPIVLISDRTIANAIHYHDILSHLWAWSARQSVHTDRLAMTRSTMNIFASEWARQAAVEHYHLRTDQHVVMPFCANLPAIPDTGRILNRLKNTQVCRLLFIGRDWVNKGGPVAIECLRSLQKMGIPSELHVVGCRIPKAENDQGLITHGFLNKNNPEQFQELSLLYENSHFFILPTRFEAYGLVFVESAAFGLPSLGPETGGVPSAMAGGTTGILLNENATGEEYAQHIAKLWNDREAYIRQITQAKNIFDSQYTWSNWVNTFLRTCENLQSPSNSR